MCVQKFLSFGFSFTFSFAFGRSHVFYALRKIMWPSKSETAFAFQFRFWGVIHVLCKCKCIKLCVSPNSETSFAFQFRSSVSLLGGHTYFMQVHKILLACTQNLSFSFAFLGGHTYFMHMTWVGTYCTNSLTQTYFLSSFSLPKDAFFQMLLERANNMKEKASFKLKILKIFGGFLT